MAREPKRIMFLYWGRRGFTHCAREIARAALAHPEISATISVSRQNESFASFAEFGPRLFPVDTFASNIGALAQAWRLPLLRHRLLDRLRRDSTEAVIELMPHVWSSQLLPSIRSQGVRYASVVHDAETHPGDYRTGMVKRLLDRAMTHSDPTFTLSDAVTQSLRLSGRVPAHRLVTLFHPDMSLADHPRRKLPLPGEPIRLLWLGRILPYKGLPLFVDAAEQLRREGLNIQVGVFGEGDLALSAVRLANLGAEVVNHWLSEAEIATVLARYDAIVLSHIEASQSGICATALGAGLPAVVTPVGGLVEQIEHGATGMIAARLDATALAEAIRGLVCESHLYSHICETIKATRATRSPATFVARCVHHTFAQ